MLRCQSQRKRSQWMCILCTAWETIEEVKQKKQKKEKKMRGKDEITRKNRTTYRTISNYSNKAAEIKEIRSHLRPASLGSLEWTADIWITHTFESSTGLKSANCDWFGLLVGQCNKIGLFDLLSISICWTFWTMRRIVDCCHHLRAPMKFVFFCSRDSFPWILNRISRRKQMSVCDGPSSFVLIQQNKRNGPICLLAYSKRGVRREHKSICNWPRKNKTKQSEATIERVCGISPLLGKSHELVKLDIFMSEICVHNCYMPSITSHHRDAYYQAMNFLSFSTKHRRRHFSSLSHDKKQWRNFLKISFSSEKNEVTVRD